MRRACAQAARYISPPPMTITSGTAPASARAASNEAAVSQPAALNPGSRLTTILRRSGNGRPMAASVLRPMSTGLPRVRDLKCLRSAGRCQGILPSLPSSLRLPAAATNDNNDISDRYRCLDGRVRLVIHDLEIFVLVVEQRRRPALEVQSRQGIRLARQLFRHLLHVVVVQVTIAAAPDEIPG